MATKETEINAIDEIGTEHSAVDSLTEDENRTSLLRNYAPPVLALVALALPWATIRAPFIGTQTLTGFDMDTGLLLALLTIGVMASVYKGWTRARLGLGALTVLTALFGWSTINSAFASAQTDLEGNMFADAVQMSTGMGVYLALIASVAMVYLAWKEYSANRA